MSIEEIQGKIKGLLHSHVFFTAVLLALVALVSYGAGRMSVGSSSASVVTSTAKVPYTTPKIEIQQQEISTSTSTPVVTPAKEVVVEKVYVGSRKSTKYHLPTCAGAKTISEENKIWFSSKEDAASQGYSPAGNCKGI